MASKWVYYELLKDSFTFQNLLDLQTIEVFKVQYSILIINHALIFGSLKGILNLLTEKWSGKNWTSQTNSSLEMWKLKVPYTKNFGVRE